MNYQKKDNMKLPWYMKMKSKNKRIMIEVHWLYVLWLKLKIIIKIMYYGK